MQGTSKSGQGTPLQAGCMSSQQHELRFASAAVHAKPQGKAAEDKEGKQDV